MKKDWLFLDKQSLCGFRTVGVLIRNDQILVQREKDGNEYALPGGHIKIGETSIDGLIREFIEETGTNINVNRLVWVEETFWKWGKKDAHTISFYYLISLTNDDDIPDNYFKSHKDNCNVLLEWKSFDEIKHLTIYPAFIKEKLGHISKNIEHFISKE
ncbi:DNA mismatch repair protein MutT [Clostridia bacterium]|nr:DNA mismatch repair protein MutT [Clostridia bacterium]